MPTEEKPLTLSQLIQYHNDMLEPRFDKIDLHFNAIEAKLDEHDQRFDDLYKKVEDLRQEYIVSNEQMRRLDKKISGMFH